MGKLHIIDHPLIQSKLAVLRDEKTDGSEFRELVSEITMLLCYEAAKYVPLVDAEVKTPLGISACKVIDGRKFAAIPILRAGLGMSDGVLRLIPSASVGHIGLYRDPETLLPVEYFCKLPGDIEDCDAFLLDPMLATGGTGSAAVRFLKDRGVKKISLLCLVCSPEAVNKLLIEHPDVDVYAAAQDRGLNSDGYIIPGLGDVGDRMFGTK